MTWRGERYGTQYVLSALCVAIRSLDDDILIFVQENGATRAIDTGQLLDVRPNRVATKLADKLAQ